MALRMHFVVVVWSVAVLADVGLVGGQVTVTPNPYGSPAITTFPPGTPPSDLKPGESADATARATVDAGAGA